MSESQISQVSKQDRRPKYRSQVKLSRGWFKVAAWGHSEIQVRKTISYPSEEDPTKFVFDDVLRWRIPAEDVPIVIAELKKAGEFCKSKAAVAQEPSGRQLVYEKIPQSGEILVDNLRRLCVPAICSETEFIEALAELHRLGLVNRRVEGADTLFPRVYVSRVVV